MTAMAFAPLGVQSSPQWYSPAPAGLATHAIAGETSKPSGHLFANQVARQASPLQPASVELPVAQHGVPLVSLGCACTTKMAFDEIGRGQKTLPFDWMCTQIEGIIGFLRNDFQGFFDFTDIEESYVGPTKIKVFRGAHHSWWHDDPTDPACRDKFLRRIQRLGSMQAHNTPILFVRTAATTDELPMADTLMQTLQQKFGREAKLLFVIAGQNAQSLGPYLVDGMPNMLAYLTSVPNGKGAFSEAVSAGLSWVAGQQLPNCRRTQSLVSIPGLIPAYTGMFGMGGLPAFDHIPAHVPRPPRSDGKPNNPTPTLPNYSAHLHLGASPFAALPRQQPPVMQGPQVTPRTSTSHEERAQKDVNPMPTLPNSSAQLPLGASPFAALPGQQPPVMQGPQVTPRASTSHEERAQKKVEEAAEEWRQHNEEVRQAQKQARAWCKTNGYKDVRTPKTTFWGNSKYVLHSAVKQEDPHAVKMLLLCGAKKDAKDSKGKTALQLAETMEPGKPREAILDLLR